MTNPTRVDVGYSDACDAVHQLLRHIGEDVTREGLKGTPERVVRSYRELFGGYRVDVPKLLTVFEDDTSDEMIILRDIEFHSVCEHHMQPFFGKAHVAYVPNERVVGISKLARVVDAYARRLQIQERLTSQVTDALMAHLKPKGAACVVESQHFCMVCRGVRKQNSRMITSSLVGVFKDDARARSEFLAMIR